MKQIQLTKPLFLIFFIVSSLSFSVSAEEETDTHLQPDDSLTNYQKSDFEVYSDASFDFSLEYPTNWQVAFKDENDKNAMSNIWIFSPKEDVTSDSHNHEVKPQIVVGHYLLEFHDKHSLEEWTELYEDLSTTFQKDQLQRSPLERQKVSDQQAVYRSGSSPITEFQYTNIVNGNVVWFVWTNIGQNADSTAYDHMVNSLQFGDKTPVRLDEIYGFDFQSLSLDSGAELNMENQTKAIGKASGLGSMAYKNPFISSSWRAPVFGTYNVQCGSSYHTGSSAYALDIGTPIGRSVYAAYSGNVYFAGWDTSGYGNLVKMSHLGGSYKSYYAHLHVIYTYNGANVVTDQFIAKSGNTGNGSAHLHFHVTYTDLTGMTGFYPNGNYPTSSNVSCGSVSR